MTNYRQVDRFSGEASADSGRQRPSTESKRAARGVGRGNERKRRTHPSTTRSTSVSDRKPSVGDTSPALPKPPEVDGPKRPRRSRRRRGGRGRNRRGGSNVSHGENTGSVMEPVVAVTSDEPVALDQKILKRRRGRTRRGQPLGRYSMYVHVGHQATHIAVLEGRRLIEYFVSRPSDDISEIHGNIYLGRVQNVLPGMETAFIDIGTPKNAVIYRGDLQRDPAQIATTDSRVKNPDERLRIEDILKAGQPVLCQVNKNPIGAKGARLTQEISLAGRFVVLLPGSSGLGISKRLSARERKRLTAIVKPVHPKGHGLILRTAAENITALEIERDIARLVGQWDDIKHLAHRSSPPALLYREPEATLRLIREELTSDYRVVAIDNPILYEEVSDYVSSIIPHLADRVRYYDAGRQKLPMFERYYVVTQLHKALNPKVWLPSGGSIIIEHTEALTVVDVNTSKNVGKSNLENTVLENNLEAADEVARQLRLRDIGGIIVVDFVDMEASANRTQVVKRFKEALARDKTRTQVLDISALGLLEMTRKRNGGGLLESLSDICESCSGRGWQLLDDVV